MLNILLVNFNKICLNIIKYFNVIHSTIYVRKAYSNNTIDQYNRAMTEVNLIDIEPQRLYGNFDGTFFNVPSDIGLLLN